MGHVDRPKTFNFLWDLYFYISLIRPFSISPSVQGQLGDTKKESKVVYGLY